jgi:hypothetical protein
MTVLPYEMQDASLLVALSTVELDKALPSRITQDRDGNNK